MPLPVPNRSVALLALALCACANETPVAEIQGDCQDTFSGEVCTWARVQGNTLLEAGALVPIASIEKAPAPSGPMHAPTPVAVLKLPESVQPQSGFTEMTMFWEAEGHPPGPYLTPHFDFHFYTIAAEERAAIDCKDTAKPRVLPAAYSLVDVQLPPVMAQVMGAGTLVGLCVPGMGMHSLPSAELRSERPFRGSMVVGYYHTKPIFIEPMITRAMLLEKKSFDLPIPDVPGLDGPHPTVFRAVWDADRQAYRFVFSGFKGGSAA